MRRLAFFAAASMVITLGARAQADDTKRAAELYDMGNKLYDQQKWSEAEAAYQSAWNLRQSFDLAGNLGDVEMQLGQYRDAAEHLSYAYDEFPAGGKPEVRAALGKRIEEAKQHLGVVRIKTNVIGARLYVDGKLVGQSPLGKAVFVDVGQRVIEARLDGHDDALRTIDVAKGSTQDLELVLSPKIGGGSTSTNTKRVAIIAVGAGLAAAGIGTGIGFLAAASGKNGDADTLDAQMPDGACNAQHPRYAEFTDTCNTLLGTLQQKDNFQNIGVGVLIAGGVIAAGTVVYALVPAKKRSSMGFVVSPAVSPTFAGFALNGHF